MECFVCICFFPFSRVLIKRIKEKLIVSFSNFFKLASTLMTAFEDGIPGYVFSLVDILRKSH